MEILITEAGLKNYYLEEKFKDEEAESGLKFTTVSDDTTVTLNYTDQTDLENKINYILFMLTDK